MHKTRVSPTPYCGALRKGSSVTTKINNIKDLIFSYFRVFRLFRMLRLSDCADIMVNRSNLGEIMALPKMKQKMSPAKSTPRSPKRGIKVLNYMELKKLIARTGKRVSIYLGNEEIQMPKSEQKLFVEAVFETIDLKGAQKSGTVLSTQEVADLLNVSRPFVVKLIENHQLKSFNVGSHRRVLEVDALAFRQNMRNEKNEALDALAKETESLGLEFK
jgi:excisionase family DNA binding protein